MKRIYISLIIVLISSNFCFAAMSALVDNNMCNAFGLLVKTDSNTLRYFYREGTNCEGSKGVIKQRSYNLTTETWGSATTVYDFASSSESAMSVGGGYVGSTFVVFTYSYNWDAATFPDWGYITTTDFVNWSSWTSVKTLSGCNLSFITHARIIQTGSNYQIPFYCRTITDGYTYHYVKLFKTTDGMTWDIGVTIWESAADATNYFHETTMENIGDGKLIVLMRQHNGNVFGYSNSDDNGLTWSAAINSNLGTNQTNRRKQAWLLYDSAINKLFAVYADRADPGTLNVSDSDSDTVYASGTAWASPTVLISNAQGEVDPGHFGYPSMEKISANHYYITFHDGANTADIPIWGGYYTTSYDLVSGLINLGSGGSKAITGSGAKLITR